jgi:hypothetical protein
MEKSFITNRPCQNTARKGMIEAEDQESASLYDRFPDVTEECVTCLTPWMTGEEYWPDAYRDLFGQPLKDPLYPCQTSSDKFLRIAASARGALAHIGFLQYSGAFTTPGFPCEIASRSTMKFLESYSEYCAILIQRFWRAKRANSGWRDKLNFWLARAIDPGKARTSQETEARKRIISDILTAWRAE